MCSANQQLSFAFDQYYKSQNKAASACSFGDSAKVQTAGSVSSDCKKLLSQAGTEGTGSVTTAPTGTAISNPGGSGGASKSGSSGSGSTGTSRAARVDVELWQLGVVLVPAGMALLGMLVL